MFKSLFKKEIKVERNLQLEFDEKFSPKFDFLEFSLADIVDDLVC